jgi:hypothetical protein
MLNGSKAYLSGPMEFSNGDYRTQPAIELLKIFGIQVFDPALDPKEQWVPDIKQAKADKDYMRIKSIAERFFRKDLGMLYQCDMTIAFLPGFTIFPSLGGSMVVDAAVNDYYEFFYTQISGTTRTTELAAVYAEFSASFLGA